MIQDGLGFSSCAAPLSTPDVRISGARSLEGKEFRELRRRDGCESEGKLSSLINIRTEELEYRGSHIYM